MPKCDFNKVVKLQNFIEIALPHECSTANLLHVFRTFFLNNTFGGLLLSKKEKNQERRFLAVLIYHSNNHLELLQGSAYVRYVSMETQQLRAITNEVFKTLCFYFFKLL